MIRRLRLGSGLLLFAYLLTHSLNHALGLVSLEALEAGRHWFLLLWRNLPASVLLYGALLLHAGLALWALYQRRRLRMPAGEAVQLAAGLSIPPLLILHILGNRLVFELFGIEDSYQRVLLIYFWYDPASAMRQFAVSLLAWLHGCIGLHLWLRLKPWYGAVAPTALVLAVAVPLVSSLGVLVAGRDVVRLARDQAWLAEATARAGLENAAAIDLVYRLEAWALAVMAVLLILTLLARLLRQAWQRRRGIVTVSYSAGQKVAVPPGTSILDASRQARVPHAEVCGGRGRCSTCRVRIAAGLADLPPPGEAETRVLARIGAAPNVRLACQTVPSRDVEVAPLLPPAIGPKEQGRQAGYLQGDEREVAILFADLRGFTTLSQDKLPYDVVFLLNRYFAAMGMAIEESGGRIDKFIGDGIMALFGVERGVANGCGNALDAAARMAERLVELNAALRSDLAQPLKIGIGIHAGPVIVGEMGYGAATSITAIGDTVNTASRLESLTKEFGVQLVVSEPVARYAAVDLADYPDQWIEVRGRSGTLQIHLVKQAMTLRPVLAGGVAQAV